MKLSSDIGTAASRGAASHPPVQPTQAEDVAAPREERAPTGPLAGLASSSAALRGRRASLAGRASPHADEEGAMLGGSHRSDSSQSSQASDATFYTAQVLSPAREIDTPDVPAAAATYAERSTAAAAEVKAQLRARLDALPFAAPSEEQTALQASYLEWADARVQERINAFGPDAGYQAVGDMKTAGTKAALPIAYECLRSFIIGAMRNPVGLATGAAYASRRPADAEELSTAMVAGVAAGSASYTSDTLLIPAMDRRARVSNLPRFQAIDPKILVPDPPPVILEITAEGKRFTRPGENNAPTLADLKAQTYDRRLGITQRQSTLDDKSLDTLLLKPVINAGFNAARRTGGEPGLLTPVGQWGLSALAIGGAGVVQKALLETGKAVARTGQMRVPDLVGGEQRLNLFALALPDKARRPAQWSDAVHFPPSYLLDTGKEALALARQGFNSANAVATTARDLLTRHMLSNVMASFGSMGAGRIITAPLRGGSHIRVAGEAVNSTAVVVQQAVQTVFNDTFWNALKAKNGANTSQAARLDNERAALAAEHQRTIERTLEALAEPVDQAIARLSGPTPAEAERAMEEGMRAAPGPGPLGQTLRTALQTLRTEIGTQSVSIATIDAVRTALREGWSQTFSGVPRDAATQALDGQLQTLKRALHDSEALRQWQSGRA
ncbi:type III secretion system effector XopF1 [Xanthomonas euvesicatoria]|uniref:type III secretion system effector XopF1 n=1 Tax=Xanthomonas euvesicatoria TaxID=456327 RepID=UPI0004DF9F2C|nr:type III secretion system effector XopF1 [Xanthomonas euvesicatoria]